MALLNYMAELPLSTPSLLGFPFTGTQMRPEHTFYLGYIGIL